MLSNCWFCDSLIRHHTLVLLPPAAWSQLTKSKWKSRSYKSSLVLRLRFFSRNTQARNITPALALTHSRAWMFACVSRSRGDRWWLFVQRLHGSRVTVRTWVLNTSGFLVFLSHRGVKRLSRSRCTAAVKIGKRGKVWFMWWRTGLLQRTYAVLLHREEDPSQALSDSSHHDWRRWSMGKTSSIRR